MHALVKGHIVVICSQIIILITAVHQTTQFSLPFGGVITSLIKDLEIPRRSIEPFQTPLGPIDKTTVAKSKAQHGVKSSSQPSYSQAGPSTPLIIPDASLMSEMFQHVDKMFAGKRKFFEEQLTDLKKENTDLKAQLQYTHSPQSYATLVKVDQVELYVKTLILQTCEVVGAEDTS